MKNFLPFSQVVSGRVFFLYIIWVLGSCRTQPVNEISAKRNISEHTVRRDLVHTFSGDTSELIITYEYYKEPASPVEDTINTRICRFLKQVTTFSSVVQECVLSVQSVTSDLDTFTALYYEEEWEEGELWMIESNVQIDEFKEYIELDLSEWDYTGGAHGNGIFYVKLFDINSARLLTLEDFISDIDQLNAIAEKYFRKLMGLDTDANLSDAGFWFEEDVFSVNDNFFFENNNLVFYYNTYEIGPYSGGPTQLELPIKELEGLLLRKP